MGQLKHWNTAGQWTRSELIQLVEARFDTVDGAWITVYQPPQSWIWQVSSWKKVEPSSTLIWQNQIVSSATDSAQPTSICVIVMCEVILVGRSWMESFVWIWLAAQPLTLHWWLHKLHGWWRRASLHLTCYATPPEEKAHNHQATIHWKQNSSFSGLTFHSFAKYYKKSIRPCTLLIYNRKHHSQFINSKY